jgi:hypothetical protein
MRYSISPLPAPRSPLSELITYCILLESAVRVRKEMGNLKSRITQLGNLLKHNQ